VKGEKTMKNLNSITRSIFIGLITFALFSVTNAQGVDLKAIKAEREAEAIKKYTELITNFYAHLYQAIADRGQSVNGKSGKIAGAGLSDKAAKVRSESVSNFDNLQSLIAKLKSANRFNEQFDKDVAKLLGAHKVKGRLTKSGGARKLLESVLNSSVTNGLKKNVTESASLVEFIKDEDTCKFIAVGIVVEALSTKKSTRLSDSIYEANGCHK
jgi:hypothetical protein